MNKSNQLLAILDRVFGFQNKIHVILIEYRVSVKGTMKSAPRRKQQPNQMAMIQQLLAQNQSKDKKK